MGDCRKFPPMLQRRLAFLNFAYFVCVENFQGLRAARGRKAGRHTQAMESSSSQGPPLCLTHYHKQPVPASKISLSLSTAPQEDHPQVILILGEVSEQNPPMPEQSETLPEFLCSPSKGKYSGYPTFR